ncbi:AAA family ATPase [Nitrincola tapanii]|uniref:AAA family ATPase n=1 Tax=Nitrincola tapanii TaxID=1708751 RepID=A0A5A9W1H8_9GAMM|nr:AAA family ATPase [Nitrincola tapanii]KAA0873968.1 AAA family ATPase [Nitrincola tapanii]
MEEDVFTPAQLHGAVRQALEVLNQVLLGKAEQVELAVTCLLSRGHLLIEDLPGMGKTTLAHALAQVFGLQPTRIQFTSDLLPADILGVSVFEPGQGTFRFHPGPIFTQLLLADEINRTTPKTQSALLEAMEEGQVSLDGVSRPLPEPFFVIATQNPTHQLGTFPLPESQLDRFLMRITLGYPAAAAEREMLMRGGTRQETANLPVCLSARALQQVQKEVEQVHASASLVDYVQRLAQFTRDHASFSYGLSPRGALALLRAARSHAWLQGRKHLLPEDVQQIMTAVIGHRVRASEEASGLGSATGSSLSVARLMAQMKAQVDVLG